MLSSSAPPSRQYGYGLQIQQLFAESVTLIPVDGSPLELTLIGALARVELSHLPPTLWSPAQPSDPGTSALATVEVSSPVSFRGATACLTLRTTKLVKQPDFVLSPGSHFHRVNYDDESGLCVGCYASFDDWLPGDPLRCGDAPTEVCGLHIPCDALEGPAEVAVSYDHPSLLPGLEEELRVGVITPEIDPECTDPATDCQERPILVTLQQSGQPLTVVRSTNLNVVTTQDHASSSAELIDFGFRARVTMDPKLVVYPPEQGLFYQQGGCSGSHGRGLCGGSKVQSTQPAPRTTRLKHGTPLYDSQGRVWSHVSEPFDVVYTPSSNPEDLVDVETQALRGLCESDDTCLCRSLHMVRQADLGAR